MNILASPVPIQTEMPPLPVYRFTEEQFRRLKEVGILGTDEPICLEDGLVVLESPAESDPRIRVSPYPLGDDQVSEPLALRRFSQSEYYRMIDVGVLRSGAPLELLEGWIVRKMTLNPPHNVVAGLAYEAISAVLPSGWHCRAGATVSTDTSEPEPDVSIIRGARRDFMTRHPGPTDTALAVEAADSSVRIDRRWKFVLYSRNAIPIYWIVNIPDNRLEVYTDPTGPAPNPEYRQRQDFGPEAEVPLILDGIEVARILVRDLLP